MRSVRETFGLVCPKCGSDDRLLVEVTSFVRLYSDGTESAGDEEWCNTSPCGCTACDHWDIVESFKAPEGGQP